MKFFVENHIRKTYRFMKTSKSVYKGPFYRTMGKTFSKLVINLAKVMHHAVNRCDKVAIETTFNYMMK